LSNKSTFLLTKKLVIW